MSNSTYFPPVNAKILAALKTGYDFTADQLKARFGIVRVSERISELRKAGFPIYLNTKVTRNGDTIKVYRLGTAKRSAVVTAAVLDEAIKNGTQWVNVYDIQNAVNQRLAMFGSGTTR